MVLANGARLGPYEILSPLGAGGMGEVYRAHDARLNRDVALKILPDIFSTDAERMVRFEREAQLLASLNHPNIATLYGLEESDGRRGLVMELVEGPTLAERIANYSGGRRESPAIPVDEALPIAKQITEALEYAHERGIIHRDLKPANIKLTGEGQVKLLDFGLAKALAGDPIAGATANSPTLSLGATRGGAILGTAGYMSPEQARGKPADRRADIWAFGVVLFEMLAGRQMYGGETAADALASVMKDEPKWDALPAVTTMGIRRLLRRCLRKDPKQRLQAIGEARIAIEEELAAPSGQSDVAVAEPSAPPRRPLAWMAATAVCLLAALGLATVHFHEPPAAGDRPLRVSIPVPKDSEVNFLELSPDGRRLALLLLSGRTPQIYLRPLDSEDFQPLPGTAGSGIFFWSPDSRSLGFFADGKLKVAPVSGGPARVLCEDASVGLGGTWNRDGVILFSSVRSWLRRVEAKGGPCKPVAEPISFAPGRTLFPQFLPDGNHFFSFRQFPGAQGPAGVYLAELSDPAGRRLLADLSNVAYAPAASAGLHAHLLFLREDTLMAQPFDEARLEPVDDPFPVAERVSQSFLLTQPAVSASANGTLVYLSGRSPESQLTWFDRDGKELNKIGSRTFQRGVFLSPDGKMAVTQRLVMGNFLAPWLLDLERKSESRLTPPGSFTDVPVWSPDSRRIWFRMTGPDGRGLYEKDLNSGQLRLLQKVDATATSAPLSDWSRDGRFLIYTESDAKTGSDIWALPVESGKPDGKAVKLVATAAVESQGQLSPDGRWLAYYSNETGTPEVYIRAFPAGGQAWKVSVDGGVEPRWRSDGKELFFGSVSGLLALSAVRVEPDGRGGLRIGPPQKLFEVRGARQVNDASNVFTYSPHPDGQSFLVNTLAEGGEPMIHVITHWQQAIQGKNALAPRGGGGN